MKIRQLLLFIFIFAIRGNPAYSKVYLTKKQALRIAFPGAPTINKKTIWFGDRDIQKIELLTRQKLRIKRMTFYTGRERGRITGYAVIDNVIGKKDFITYMTVLAPDGKVRRIEILVFRESQGWEIIDRVWRNQFTGKDLKDALQLNKDIINISGATLSCRSITKGVKKILSIFKVTIKRKKTG